MFFLFLLGADGASHPGDGGDLQCDGPSCSGLHFVIFILCLTCCGLWHKVISADIGASAFRDGIDY